jgi:hypothetical protein
MSLLGDTLSGVQFIDRLKGRRRQKKVTEIRDKMWRHFEHSQRRVRGAFSASLDNLVAGGVVRDEERSDAIEALSELVDNGLLTFDFPFYYLRGREPRAPF